MIYRISTISGVELGYVEDVRYIKIHPKNKCFVKCDKKDAIGVAFKGTPYNLNGFNSIPDAKTVNVTPVTVSEQISQMTQANRDLEAQLVDADEAAIELYELNLIQEDAEAEQDEAIIQIYEMIGDVSNG